MSSGRLELWTNEHPDGMARRPDDWQGTEIFDLQTVLNLLEALLNSGISVQKHHYKEVILSNRMQPKYNPGPNQKLLPIFVTKGQRVRQSN